MATAYVLFLAFIGIVCAFGGAASHRADWCFTGVVFLLIALTIHLAFAARGGA